MINSYVKMVVTLAIIFAVLLHSRIVLASNSASSSPSLRLANDLKLSYSGNCTATWLTPNKLGNSPL
ncbi:hypothetical protein [Sporisorium scitamineum]|uniref:Uncharacterized protein n=1 Tax=Sporisorium scitamineum TaxID=49012 RepID=A0A0F7S1N6_9BASI|nr:hypothetical protein [Sporisorium scitamineum]